MAYAYNPDEAEAGELQIPEADLVSEHQTRKWSSTAIKPTSTLYFASPKDKKTAPKNQWERRHYSEETDHWLHFPNFPSMLC